LSVRPIVARIFRPVDQLVLIPSLDRPQEVPRAHAWGTTGGSEGEKGEALKVIQIYRPPIDPKTGEPVPFTHLCPDADCKCENDVLAGIAPASGPMVPRIPEWFSEAMEELEMGFKRRDPSKGPQPLPNAWADPVDKSDFPNIFAFLTETKYDDGKPRMTGSFSVWTQLGVLKASVNDRDLGQVFYIEANTLHELIEMIERGICDDNTDWKASKKSPPF